MTDAMARATARSAAGSVTVMPPTAAANIWDDAGISTGGPARQDGEEEVGPRRVDAQGLRPGRPRAAAVAGTEQRLHLDQQRPTALQDRHHHAARDAGHAVPEHERAGVRHGAQAVVAHLEDADLPGRAEAVLDRGQHAEGVVAVAVEGEDGVDQVLHRPRPGQVAVLGHVAHQEQRGAARLRHSGQSFDAGPHLGQAAGRLAQVGVRDGLERVHHHERRAVARRRRPRSPRRRALRGPAGALAPGRCATPARAPAPATPRPRPA